MVYRARISTCARRKWGLHWGAISPAGSGEPAANGTHGRTGAARSLPIWVDGTVLACCNHAYEIAGAHRAGEVRPSTCSMLCCASRRPSRTSKRGASA